MHAVTISISTITIANGAHAGAKRFLVPTSISYGDVVYPPGGALGPRIQASHQFVLIHRGSMTVRIDERAHEVGGGTITLLLPGHRESFEFAVDRETYHSWVHLQLPDLAPEIGRELVALPRTIPLSREMEWSMASLLRLGASPSLSTRPQIERSIVTQMLWRYIGEARLAGQVAAGGRPGLDAIDRALNFVHDHLSEPLSILRIAEAVVVSPTHLIRLFRAHVGQTPMAYVWTVRVRRGIDLLEYSGLTVAQIADRSGFRSSYHFSRIVKLRTGLRPTQIRAGADPGQRDGNRRL